MPTGSAVELLQNTNAFLQAYTRAGNLADRQNLLLFNAVPKLHWMWHMAARAKFLHPRRVSCFIDEDFVGHMKRIAATCVHGAKQHLVPKRVLLKYRWGVGLQK